MNNGRRKPRPVRTAALTVFAAAVAVAMSACGAGTPATLTPAPNLPGGTRGPMISDAPTASPAETPSPAAPQSPPRVGDLAPGFTLPAAGGGEVTLEQYRGERPVVLVFYRAFW